VTGPGRLARKFPRSGPGEGVDGGGSVARLEFVGSSFSGVDCIPGGGHDGHHFCFAVENAGCRQLRRPPPRGGGSANKIFFGRLSVVSGGGKKGEKKP